MLAALLFTDAARAIIAEDDDWRDEKGRINREIACDRKGEDSVEGLG